MICMIELKSTGTIDVSDPRREGTAAANDVRRATPPCTRAGSSDSTRGGSCSPMALITFGSVSASLGMISPRFFTTTLAAVWKASANSSALPDPASRLSQEDFMLLTDPSIVLAASFAVVPVIPMAS